MPSTRHSTGSTRATGPSKGQSTLSFHNKVTKNINHDAKKSSVVSPSVTKVTPPTPVEVEPTKDEVEEIENEEPDEEVKPEKSESEINAEKVSDAQIGKYWKGIEKERRAPRIHQQGLSDHEKILRYFDVSSQYGVSPQSSQLKQKTLTKLAMHWHRPPEAMGACRPPGLEPTHRGSRGALAGGAK